MCPREHISIITHLFDSRPVRNVFERVNVHVRAHERACVYVGCTRGDQSVDTYSRSKPGRADRSGQSASALSLFKVRLTLSTILEKKLKPGPPILSDILQVHISLCLFIRSHQSIPPSLIQIRSLPIFKNAFLTK